MRIGFSGKAAGAEAQTKNVAPMHAKNRRSENDELMTLPKGWTIDCEREAQQYGALALM
jgi:hypothetical protein